ncbi:MAG: GNAT family N-acetyltransferase [Maribacter sp.]
MIRAKYSDKVLVVSILVEAFEPLREDNSINFVVKQDKKRTERIRILMEYMFDKALRTGEVFLSDNRASCLLISYAHKDKFSLGKLTSTIRLALKCIGIERIQKVLKRQKIVSRNYPYGAQIRPMIFAVKQEYKGTVTAAKLILQVFKEFKNNELPVIVDTTSEDHVKLYQKFGLKVFNIEKELGFPIYLLRMN